MSNEGSKEGLFGPEDVIIAYTRAQAIEDGVLVDVTETAKKAGILSPVALTRAVWDRYVKLTPAAELVFSDERGRLWDILWMFRCAALATRDSDVTELVFSLLVITEYVEPSPVQLKAVCGPGDEGEPVLTIMLPEED